MFFVPVDYLLNCKEEVYRYVVSAKVDDDFPYERIGFPKTYPWRKGYMNVPIYEYRTVSGVVAVSGRKAAIHGQPLR